MLCPNKPPRIGDVNGSSINTKLAFLVGVIDKEIRLSFTKRIRETLPKEYHMLIPEGKEKDVPDFKYSNPGKSVRNLPSSVY
jgi:nuclear cap-binding protein subunit 1